MLLIFCYYKAAGSGSLPCVEYLCERGVDIDDVNYDNWTAQYNGIYIMNLLDTNYKEFKIKVFLFLLYEACFKKNYKIMKYLCNRGANCNISTNTGITSLHQGFYFLKDIYLL